MRAPSCPAFELRPMASRAWSGDEVQVPQPLLLGTMKDAQKDAHSLAAGGIRTLSTDSGRAPGSPASPKVPKNFMF